MIHEFARLHVIPGQETAFEAAFAEAQHIIAAMPGFLGLNLYRQHPDGAPYLLHVRWENVAAHRDGFRQSPQYQQWKALLHHFYDPFPTVEYFETLFAQ
ncbi:MAG: antibiotic biosynthesis monooxygenase [Cardiobacteriaceae bacterium]|nr:antibiotic biosynthesis monooxygenase [Cardiobacteriaceae bacterium]